MDLQRLLTSMKISHLTRSASLFTRIASAIKLRNNLKALHHYVKQLYNSRDNSTPTQHCTEWQIIAKHQDK